MVESKVRTLNDTEAIVIIRTIRSHVVRDWMPASPPLTSGSFMKSTLGPGVVFLNQFRKLLVRAVLDIERYPFRISRAALYPGAPITPPPGCVPDPHKYKPWMGVL